VTVECSPGLGGVSGGGDAVEVEGDGPGPAVDSYMKVNFVLVVIA
jgi:hypothetical protein